MLQADSAVLKPLQPKGWLISCFLGNQLHKNTSLPKLVMFSRFCAWDDVDDDAGRRCAVIPLFSLLPAGCHYLMDQAAAGWKEENARQDEQARRAPWPADWLLTEIERRDAKMQASQLDG